MRTKLTCVGLAERAMQMVNFGFAVISVRSGSMASVSALPPRRRSTSSSTIALAAAARGAANDKLERCQLMYLELLGGMVKRRRTASPV
jgi:hypothetical protein